jgi:hypothetical protein
LSVTTAAHRASHGHALTRLWHSTEGVAPGALESVSGKRKATSRSATQMRITWLPPTARRATRRT